MESKALFATRAEELGNRVFDYFAMPAESFYTRLLKNKAAVLVGGRGTGKTMLLKSMAFEYKVINKTVDESSQVWFSDHYLGCYIRADTNIVSGFKGRGIDDESWQLLFAHYFNFRTLQQIVKTIKSAVEKLIITEKDLEEFIERYGEVLGYPRFEIQSLKEMEENIRYKLDELVRYINNPKKRDIPELTNNGTLIFECCQMLSNKTTFANKTWYILIDEYENLNEDQQRIINTLIKANQPPVIFKIAMRPGGWWTQETLTPSENLEKIADFDMIDYQTDFSQNDYEELIIKAFNKSLILNQIEDPYFQDVRNLLPEISPEDEARRVLDRSKKKNEFNDQIIQKINESTKIQEEQLELKKILVDENDPLRTRFHLVLLDRNKSPQQIARQILNQQQKYLESYRHYRMGTLFLLCREYKQKKLYAGFNTYVLLSSKIMRNFVSLFSRAWELSSDNGFTVHSPKAFSYEDQSDAAYDVSQGKVFEISAYPSGSKLSSFANHLGRIFEQLNKDHKQSQPERNHFVILGDISQEAKNLMRGALMYSILQEVPATKLRSEVEVKGTDYLFNRIYCPYYYLSYRKMHKLELKADVFEKLLLGANEEKRVETAKLLSKYLKDDTLANPEIMQLDLFDI